MAETQVRIRSREGGDGPLSGSYPEETGPIPAPLPSDSGSSLVAKVPGLGPGEREFDSRLPDQEFWWCNSHQRRATTLDKDGKYRCDPYLGGILLPCSSVRLTGIVEIVYA